MRFFSVDNPVWRFIRKIGYLWLLNILWVLTSLPVITIGASTTALFYACMKLQGDEGYPTANYFRSFRENFRQATIIWLIYAAVGALLVYGLIFWLCLTLESNNSYGAVKWFERLVVLAMMLSVIAGCFNYLDIQSLFAPCRSSSRPVRYLGIALLVMSMVSILLVLLILVEGYIFPAPA
jgi:uncharacterized membrane protein YesL